MRPRLAIFLLVFLLGKAFGDEPETTEPPEEEDPKNLDDPLIYAAFSLSPKLRPDTDADVRLGVLALYYRLHKKHVLRAIEGYEYGYPDGVGYRFYKAYSDRDVCGIHSSMKMDKCIETLYNVITHEQRTGNSWLLAKKNTSITGEFMREALDERWMEQDLTGGQILCHMTMRFEFMRAPIPFCGYRTLDSKEIKEGQLPAAWNAELLETLQFDRMPEDGNCAMHSFCPNPCDEKTPQGHYVMSCPTAGSKCELSPEFNSDFIMMRHNDWNETCNCPTHKVYQKEAGTCVLQNFCRFHECPVKQVCKNNADGPTCICQLGYYDVDGECLLIEERLLAWDSLAVSAALGPSTNTIFLLTTLFYALS
ncbi:unnamed protein product, partial [Mesorhabditis spiculigera]